MAAVLDTVDARLPMNMIESLDVAFTVDKVSLAARGLKLDDVLCPFCSQLNETVLHTLWQCSSLKSIRHISSVSSFGKSLVSLSFFDFVLSCKDRAGSSDFEVFYVIWWRIWHCWNQLVHSSTLIPESGFLKWADAFISDFRHANIPVSSGSPSRQAIHS
ncbi:hypothetical protein QYF36_023747 [Acer negundo]|nr:hypothetical protein QYF36_023747 [Acer negundo]